MIEIGVNRQGIDQRVGLGREIEDTGKGLKGKEKAIRDAQVHKGSELVYQTQDGHWHVSELNEKDIVGTSALSQDDAKEISLNSEQLQKQGIQNPVISFVEEDLPDSGSLSLWRSPANFFGNLLFSDPQGHMESDYDNLYRTKLQTFILI